MKQPYCIHPTCDKPTETNSWYCEEHQRECDESKRDRDEAVADDKNDADRDWRIHSKTIP